MNTMELSAHSEYTSYLSPRQRKFIDLLPDGLAIFNQQGIILEWNRAAVEFSRIPGELVRGRHWRTVYEAYVKYLPIDLSPALSHLEELLNGQVVNQTIKVNKINYVSPYGEVKHGEYFLCPMIVRGENVVMGLLRDVSRQYELEKELEAYRQHLQDMVDKRTAELKEANAMLQMEIAQRQVIEAELSEKNRQLELIMNTASTPIYLKDKTGNILQVNQAFLDYFELTNQEVIGRPLEKICYPEYIALHKEADQQIQNRPTSYRHQSSVITKDGFIRDVIFNSSALLDDNGNYDGMVGVITDITDKLAIEKKLHNSRVWFDHCFNNHLYGICITIAATGVFIDLNDTLLNQLGYRKEELIGHPIKDFNIWRQYSERAELIAELDEKTFVVNKEVSFRNKDGHLIPFLLSAQMFDFEGETYLFVVLNNVAEYIEAAKDFARLDRLNIIGEMAASIGHEIRNPMTSVRGILQLYKPHHNEIQDVFELMISELDRANSIITEFLNLAPDKVSNPQLTNLNKIISTIYPLLQAEAICQEKILVLQLDPVPDLLLDANEIKQLLVNLVKNALEAIAPKSQAIISTTTVNNRALLKIIDNGPGIPSEIIDSIWKPFVTTKANGTGLGLSVCYTIATRHQATISVESSSGGTTFTVSFPIPWLPTS